jgi:hypothetical protein
MKNYQLLLFSGISFFIGAQILGGGYSQYFAGELNELGCAIIALSMSTLSLLGVNWKKFGHWLVSY